jgi:hypothetical protein
MRLEHFPADGDQKSVVLIYDAAAAETQALLGTFDLLRSDQPVNPVLVELLPGCEPIDGCSLTLRRGEEHLGTHPVQERRHAFCCTLTPAGWSHAWWMLEPFPVDKPGHFFQYLTEVGSTELIFSTHRGW